MQVISDFSHEAAQTGMRIRGSGGWNLILIPVWGASEKIVILKTCIYQLDLANFTEKYIGLTYAAVTASKNECNCIFSPSKLWVCGWPLVSFFS